MNDTITLSRKLNETIKSSELYRTYEECKAELLKRPDLLRALNEFKQKNLDIQNNENIDNPYDEINHLFSEYDGLLRDTVVNNFVRSEQRLCKMMKLMYEEIADGLDIGIEED
jgi:cell fate (sporulation/competence/biofilm development) regulator YlbF (YheA/YmcA/DUF963 family)